LGLTGSERVALLTETNLDSQKVAPRVRMFRLLESRVPFWHEPYRFLPDERGAIGCWRPKMGMLIKYAIDGPSQGLKRPRIFARLFIFGKNGVLSGIEYLCTYHVRIGADATWAHRSTGGNKLARLGPCQNRELTPQLEIRDSAVRRGTLETASLARVHFCGRGVGTRYNGTRPVQGNFPCYLGSRTWCRKSGTVYIHTCMYRLQAKFAWTLGRRLQARVSVCTSP
jgi:hypothetical protein